jgi:hypothetical protein
MLANRVLPPILRPPSPPPVTPVATFFHVPRRYVKSNMQVCDNASPNSPSEESSSSQSKRKSNRIHELRSTSTTSPVQNTKEEQLPSPAFSSSRASKKRASNLDGFAGPVSPEDDATVDSPSLPSGVELSEHLCLCQPEPKIPRPRNGESDVVLYSRLP